MARVGLEQGELAEVGPLLVNLDLVALVLPVGELLVWFVDLEALDLPGVEQLEEVAEFALPDQLLARHLEFHLHSIH